MGNDCITAGLDKIVGGTFNSTQSYEMNGYSTDKDDTEDDEIQDKKENHRHLQTLST